MTYSRQNEQEAAQMMSNSLENLLPLFSIIKQNVEASEKKNPPTLLINCKIVNKY